MRAKKRPYVEPKITLVDISYEVTDRTIMDILITCGNIGEHYIRKDIYSVYRRVLKVVDDSNDSTIGYILYDDRYNYAWELVLICRPTDIGYRRLGTLMLNTFINYVKQFGVKWLRIVSVTDKITWYMQFGFKFTNTDYDDIPELTDRLKILYEENVSLRYRDQVTYRNFVTELFQVLEKHTLDINDFLRQDISWQVIGPLGSVLDLKVRDNIKSGFFRSFDDTVDETDAVYMHLDLDTYISTRIEDFCMVCHSVPNDKVAYYDAEAHLVVCGKKCQRKYYDKNNDDLVIY